MYKAVRNTSVNICFVNLDPITFRINHVFYIFFLFILVIGRKVDSIITIISHIETLCWVVQNVPYMYMLTSMKLNPDFSIQLR